MDRKAASGAGIGAALLMTSLSTTAFAEANNAHVEGIIVGTYQAATASQVNGQDVDDEVTGQFYLYGTLDMGPGAWNLEIRGGTTPTENGVSTNGTYLRRNILNI